MKRAPFLVPLPSVTISVGLSNRIFYFRLTCFRAINFAHSIEPKSKSEQRATTNKVYVMVRNIGIGAEYDGTGVNEAIHDQQF
jgi:hypothetical protein